MKRFGLIVLASIVLAPLTAYAGCGCDKPPPAPAAIIPHAAFPGMPITLFHKGFKAGQTWDVTFKNATSTETVRVPIVAKRALSRPRSKTHTPQLVVLMPDVSIGPTGITVSRKKDSFTVAETEFTTIGKPVAVGEHTGTFAVKGYTAGVGSDGTVYISVAGLNNVCQPMSFRGALDDYPLRFGSGDISITNYQGFFIEPLDASTADHFSIQSGTGEESNVLLYQRHSFTQWCRTHQIGEGKEVTSDVNWHRDGTAHTDYSTLIFAIAGHLADGSTPKPGSVTFNIQLQTDVTEARSDARSN